MTDPHDQLLHEENVGDDVHVNDHGTVNDHAPVGQDAPVASLLPGPIMDGGANKPTAPSKRRSQRLRDAHWNSIIVPSTVHLTRLTCRDEYVDRRLRPTTIANSIWIRRYEGNHGIFH
jgi:hypothetical protein